VNQSGGHALPLFLRRLMLRSALTQQEQDAVLSLSSYSVKLMTRRDLVTPGERVDYSCLVADGLVARFEQTALGSRRITAFHIAGDMIDLHSVVLPVASWGTTALTTSTVLKIPHADLQEIATRFPAIARAFWRDTAVDAAVLAKWVANVGQWEARLRIAHVLCEMGRRMEAVRLGTRSQYRFSVTQEQLGNALALTSVHVNRMLRSLREEGILTFRRSEVDIRNLPLLESMANFDPTFLMLDTR
jgi:CRP-like cAMP-binding protein